MPTSTDNLVKNPVLNVLTKTIYDSITPSNTELYAVDMEFTGTKILATNANGEIIESTVPTGQLDFLTTQSGNSGKFLTTNGTSASWAAVDALPSQSGQSGKFLTTDGTSASWATISLSGYEETTNKVTSLSSSSTDTQYPSAKCVYDVLGDIETLIDAL